MKFNPKYTLLFSMIILLLCQLGTVSAALEPNVIVSSFNIKEGSAQIGKNFTLELTMVNTEPSACAQAVSATISANNPFIMNGLSTATVGSLCIGDTRVIDFPMRVDPSAAGGTYQITITSTYETSLLAQYSSTSTINVFVSGSPSLNAHITSSNPVDVYPGDTAALTINVENDGGFQAQAVNANLTAPTPLDVKWGNSYAALGSIDAKTGKDGMFSVEVPKDAPAMDYPMTLRVTYLDENLQPQTATFPLVFHVRPIAKFDTVDDGSDGLYADESGKTVRLTLENTGTDAARKMTAKLLPQFPFSTDGSVRYIENLPAGQGTPVTYTVDIDKDATPGNYELDMLVEWQDAQGQKLQDTATVELTVAPKSFWRAVFIDYWILWVAVVLVALLVVRKRMSNKKPAGKK